MRFGEAEAPRLFEAVHDEVGWAGHGSIDQSLDHGQPPGSALGHGEPRPWRYVPRRVTGSVMSAETPIVFVVDDDRSVRDSLHRLIAPIILLTGHGDISMSVRAMSRVSGGARPERRAPRDYPCREWSNPTKGRVDAFHPAN